MESGPVTGKSLAETAETPCKYFARGGGKMRRALSLSYRSPRRKMSIDRGPERAGQGQLVLADGQKLLVLDIGKIAELDQGVGDIGRGEHGKARRAMGARQQAHTVLAEGQHDGVGEPAGIV